MIDKQHFQLLGISLIIVRNKEGKYLCVKEKKNRGWWIPGGRVDPPESFQAAAVRETREEAGVDVALRGVIKIEMSLHDPQYMRQRVVFFAEPVDEAQKPKSVPDKESEGAAYLTLEEIRELRKGPVGWRGPEIIEFAEYLENGGVVCPLSVLGNSKEKLQNGLPFKVKP